MTRKEELKCRIREEFSYRQSRCDLAEETESFSEEESVSLLAGFSEEIQGITKETFPSLFPALADDLVKEESHKYVQTLYEDGLGFLVPDLTEKSVRENFWKEIGEFVTQRHGAQK